MLYPEARSIAGLGNLSSPKLSYRQVLYVSCCFLYVLVGPSSSTRTPIWLPRPIRCRAPSLCPMISKRMPSDSSTLTSFFFLRLYTPSRVFACVPPTADLETTRTPGLVSYVWFCIALFLCFAEMGVLNASRRNFFLTQKKQQCSSGIAVDRQWELGNSSIKSQIQ